MTGQSFTVHREPDGAILEHPTGILEKCRSVAHTKAMAETRARKAGFRAYLL
jgi:hypothetical protein